MPGVDEGQRHSLGGRRRLFPRVQRNNVGDQRGKRPCATSSAPCKDLHEIQSDREKISGSMQAIYAFAFAGP